jgi:hypothetical protein
MGRSNFGPMGRSNFGPMGRSNFGPMGRWSEVDVSEHTHVVNNGKTDLTIDELARQQPGMDRLMAELAPRVHRLAYAGWARNWPLAGYFYKSVRKQLALSAASRPKYDPEMTSYLSEDCAPVGAAIAAGDGPGFDAAYARMVRRANDYHAVFGKPFISWRTPSQPPDDLDLTAGM